jgi:hypothetical protein
MANITKALLLNVGVFEAHNSVRKSKGAYSLNYQNTANNISTVEVDVEGGAGFTFQSPINPSSLTMIRASGGPVLATVVLGVVNGVRTAEETISVVISQFFILDDNVQSVTVTNQGVDTVIVSITQG